MRLRAADGSPLPGLTDLSAHWLETPAGLVRVRHEDVELIELQPGDAFED